MRRVAPTIVLMDTVLDNFRSLVEGDPITLRVGWCKLNAAGRPYNCFDGWDGR